MQAVCTEEYVETVNGKLLFKQIGHSAVETEDTFLQFPIGSALRVKKKTNRIENNPERIL